MKFCKAIRLDKFNVKTGLVVCNIKFDKWRLLSYFKKLFTKCALDYYDILLIHVSCMRMYVF